MADYWNKYRTNLHHCGDPSLNMRTENVRILKMVDFAIVNRGLHEPLFQLRKNGPVYDGDVISKSARDSLLDVGACAKVLVNNEDGFNACTYLGRELLDVYDWVHGPLGKSS